MFKTWLLMTASSACLVWSTLGSNANNPLPSSLDGEFGQTVNSNLPISPEIDHLEQCQAAGNPVESTGCENNAGSNVETQKRIQEELNALKQIESDVADTELWVKHWEQVTEQRESEANEALKRYRKPGEINAKGFIDVNVTTPTPQEMFKKLDLNLDGILDFEEVEYQSLLDVNRNDKVDTHEADWYVSAMPGVPNEKYFREEMWENLKKLLYGKRTSACSKENEDEDDETLSQIDEETNQLTANAVEARSQLIRARDILAHERRRKLMAERSLGRLLHPDQISNTEDEENFDREYSPFIQNFGPKEKMIQFPFNMMCFKHTNGTYTYKVCMFMFVTRGIGLYDGSQTDVINLGDWEGWTKLNGEPVMVYRNGTECDLGKQFQTIVKTTCTKSRIHTLTSVEQTKPCIFVMNFRSPIGCLWKKPSKPQKAEL